MKLNRTFEAEACMPWLVGILRRYICVVRKCLVSLSPRSRRGFRRSVGRPIGNSTWERRDRRRRRDYYMLRKSELEEKIEWPDFAREEITKHLQFYDPLTDSESLNRN